MRRLPREVAFAVIPGLPDSVESAKTLARAGFDVLCHLPMEPLDSEREDAPVSTIRGSMTDDEIRKDVLAGILSVPAAIGVNNHQGSRATCDPRVMRLTLEVIRSRDLLFVDSRTSPRSLALRTARGLGLRAAGRDVFLDDDPDPTAIERQFRQLLDHAKANGRGLGIGHVRSATIDALESSFAALPRTGARLVRIGEFVGSRRGAARPGITSER